MRANIKDILSQYNGGTCFVEQGDTVIHLPFGDRDLANKIKNNETTRFATASLGKIFTAVGILQLVDAGLLTLDTTIGSVLPFDLKQIDPDVTIQQLLTHTSGIPNYFDEDKMEDYAMLFQDLPNYRVRSGKDLLPLFIDQPMMYPRGDHFAYNDSGFVVLGMILEEVMNLPFDGYLTKHLFQPLGMTSSGYFAFDRLPANTANAYIWDEDTASYYTNIYSVDAKGSGAGGAFVTAIDMNRFWKGLLAGKLLSSEMLKTMLLPHVKEDDFGYGLGVWLTPQGDPYVVGDDPGVSCVSVYIPNQPQQITLISNYHDDVFAAYRQIRELLS